MQERQNNADQEAQPNNLAEDNASIFLSTWLERKSGRNSAHSTERAKRVEKRGSEPKRWQHLLKNLIEADIATSNAGDRMVDNRGYQIADQKGPEKKSFSLLVEKRGPAFESSTNERVQVATRQERLSSNAAPVEEVSPQAEIVLEKVIEAANHDEALERVYERRHEVKDEDTKSNAPQTTGLVQVGSVVAQALNEQTVDSTRLLSIKALREAARQKATLQHKPLYKTAVIRGISIGVAIVLVALVYSIIH